MVKVRKNLQGEVFGRLTVIEQAEDYIKPNGRHVDQWLCECNCEEHKKVIVLGDSLKGGRTSSCGCLQRERASRTNQKQNKYDLSGEYGIIWSTNTDEEVFFDLCDAEKILMHTWYIDNHGYPATMIDRTQIEMHVFLGYKWHDHHNRNRLDNRSENLRPCTPSENSRNKIKPSNNKSGIIGVFWKKKDKRWVAQVTVNNKAIYLGGYTNKEDAIRARLKAEKEYYKEFAPQIHLFEEYGI